MDEQQTTGDGPPEDGERAYELHRQAIAAVTAYLGAYTGATAMADVPALLEAIGPPEALILPLCGLVLRVADLYAEVATVAGAPMTVEDVLRGLGEEAAQLGV